MSLARSISLTGIDKARAGEGQRGANRQKRKANREKGRMKITRKEAWPTVRHAFPTYTGRKFSLEFTEAPTVHDLNWGGGTRNKYVVVKLASDFECQAFPEFTPWANPIEGERFPMRPGFALIEHSIFCGKDCGIRIYAHPADETKALTVR